MLSTVIVLLVLAVINGESKKVIFGAFIQDLSKNQFPYNTMKAKEERRMSIDLQNDLKSMNNIQSIDEFDFDQIDLVRGETPNDIKETCLKLCQDYLSGNWNQQTIDTIEVRRVCGGLTNQLYYCGVINKSDKQSDVPQEVAVRLYGRKYYYSSDNERLSDAIIGIMVSENNLGPKIYGIHETGQIQAFYKHRQFTQELQKDQHLVKQVFQSLARIHSMDVPIKKNINWISDELDKYYKEAYDKFDIAHQIDQYKCEYLKKYDFKAEMEWTREALKQADSPIVFAHNDFRSSNLMITEPNNELVVCDFEHSRSGYRGFDFTELMREWGRSPWDYKSMSELPPPDSVFRPLVEIYVEECIRIKGKSFAENPINSVDHILKEIKIYLLNTPFFLILYLMKNDEKDSAVPLNRKLSMEFAELCFKAYFDIKNKLIEQKIIV